MPAKDIYHNVVRNALIKDGWTITHDPYQLSYGKRDMFVDLGAEQLLAAEKEHRQIAVEVKSFVGLSEIEDLRNALGQFILYSDLMEITDPTRVLYLAVRDAIYYTLFEEPVGQVLLKKDRLRLIVFDPTKEEIERWVL